MKLTVAPHEEWIAHDLRVTNAILEDSHLHLKSGRHSDVYIDCDRLFTDPWRMAKVYDHWMHDWFHGSPASERPEVIVAPAVGGVYLVGGFSQVLKEAGFNRVRIAWADKAESSFVLERAGFAAAVRGKRVLVIEDVITTGGSTQCTIDAVREAGGEVIGVACIVNRTRDVTAETFGVSALHVCLQLDVVSYGMDICPMCRAGRPMVLNLAHGPKFLEIFEDYPTIEVDLDAA